MPSDESKPEVKAEPRPEPKPEPKTEPRVEARADPRVEARADPREPRGEDERSMRQRLEGLIPELVRRTISSGLGAVTGDEGLGKLPANVASYVMQTAQLTKEEIVRIVAREVHDFLTSARVREEIASLLTQLALEVKMEVRFLPVAGAPADVTVKSEVKKATVKAVE